MTRMMIHDKTVRPGEHLIHEVNPAMSRTTGMLKGATTPYETGLILGKLTDTDQLVPWDPTLTDGSEIAVGVLFAGVDTKNKDIKCVYHRALAQMLSSKIVFKPGLGANAWLAGFKALEALNIYCSDEVAEDPHRAEYEPI